MIARLEVTRGSLTEYPLAEKVCGGWQNGVMFYPDAEVTKVTPLIFRNETPTDDDQDALAQIVCRALEHQDGGEECEVDFAAADAILAGGFRRSVVPEPSAPMSLADDPMRAPFQKKSPEPQGEPSSEVPEPSTEVLSDWFTSSHGVAVAAVKPMTDRGPSVMVDGRVISPNDVAALIEFKAQGERFSEIPEPSTIWHDVAAFLESKGLADGGIADFIRENAPEPQGEPSDARAKVIDALVMTRLSDFAGTDMGVIEQAADAVLAALRAAGVGGAQ